MTFCPLAQILLHEMGEAAHAPPEALRARLEEIVVECTPPDEAKEIVDRLCIALGIAGEARDEKRYAVAEIRSGLLALLRGYSGRGPVVLVLEDLQAAQEPMLELVEEMVREADGIPLLVICAARYTLLDDRPGWGGGRDLTPLVCYGLSHARNEPSSRSLARRLSQISDAPGGP